MTLQENYDRAVANLTKANEAYIKAMDGGQYTQAGQWRTANYDLKDLLNNVQYWEKQVNLYSAQLGLEVVANRVIAGPLRPNL